MAIEVECASCNGRLRVEKAGTVVACPHCGVHLEIPETDEDVPPSSIVSSRNVPVRDEAQPVANSPRSGPDSVLAALASAAGSAETSANDDPGDASPTDEGDVESAAPSPTGSDSTPDFSRLAVHEQDERPAWMPAAAAADAHEPEEPAVAFPVVTAADSPDSSDGDSSSTRPEEDGEDATARVPESPDPQAEEEVAPVDEAAASDSAPDFSKLNVDSPSEGRPPWLPPPEEGTRQGDAETGPTTFPDFQATSASGAAEVDSPRPPASSEAAESTPGVPSVTTGDDAADVGEEDTVVTRARLAEAAASLPGDATASTTATDSTAVRGAPAETPPRKAAAVATGPVVSRQLFLIVASYASAITLAFVLLLWSWLKGPAHRLESLPDVIPPMDEEDRIAWQLVPENAAVPRGHTLRLGERRRYGNLIVQPLRVTREPLEFAHWEGAAGQTRPSVGPVLKLWVRFENASDDQQFMPLGKELLFNRRESDRGREYDRANNFVAPIEGGALQGRPVLVYDLNTKDVWNIAGLDHDRELAPGEVYETFIPTTAEGIDALQGELVWRLHIRKGYNPESRRGVTTLVEVRFDSSRISGASESGGSRVTLRRSRHSADSRS